MKVLIVEPGKYPREADIEHIGWRSRYVWSTTIRGWNYGSNFSFMFPTFVFDYVCEV